MLRDLDMVLGDDDAWRERLGPKLTTVRGIQTYERLSRIPQQRVRQSFASYYFRYEDIDQGQFDNQIFKLVEVLLAALST